MNIIAKRISIGSCLLAASALVAVQALALYAMGRPLICTCGVVRLWGGIVSGPETSQQFIDWYTYSHVLHGIIFYFALKLIAPRTSVATRFLLAMALEVGWEVVENTAFIIDRYRQSAIAQGYFGDSIVNSVSDTLVAALGYLVARTLPAWATAVLAIAVELLMAALIRDNLTLNIIQLIHPTEAISRWQSGG